MTDKSEQKAPTPYEIPKDGSLGLLALGYKGLVSWRAVRGTDWIEERRKEHEELKKQVEAKRAEAEKSGEAKEQKKAAATPQKRLSAEELAGLSITIVSGLPRSGTSMMMQMLTAGGMSAYADGVREADESNKKGYFEHENVKAIAQDYSWLPETDGLVVKIVAPLLRYLPIGPTYKIVFMERDIEEILNSQSSMLDRDGRTSGDKEVLRRAYQRQLREAKTWIAHQKTASALSISHAQAMTNPDEVASSLNTFLGTSMPEDQMAAIVDTSLHRERA